MTASSVLVPIAGLLTQPILAQSLGVEGRGELAAALAPAALALAVATLGLPDSLMYHLARHPAVTRQALAVAAAVTFVLGGVCLALVYVTRPFLSVGDQELGLLITIAMSLTIPALVLNVLRGAASGRQLWTEVAVERVLSTVLRVVILGGLALIGNLTVLTAVLASTLIPAAAGLVYWRLLMSPPHDPAEPPLVGPLARNVLSYGSRVWLGSVASMLLSRLDQLFMAPLSSVQELGLYSVAVTVADVPLIVVLAISGALTGVNSRSNDPNQVTSAARMTLLLGAIGCGGLAAVAPFLVPILFGFEFVDSTLPTIMLIVSALVCIPGLMASAGISARGRPGLRSIGLAVTLVANLSCFVVLVPTFGALGGAVTSIISNIVLSTYMVVIASRLMKAPVRDFILVRRTDMAQAWNEANTLVRRLRRRGSPPPLPPTPPTTDGADF